jgi:excinuclease ABC subunit A
MGSGGHAPHWKGNWNKQWYGIRRFFEYLESKAYKMHIRVLLSKYRSYTPCGGLRRRAAQDWSRCCGGSARWPMHDEVLDHCQAALHLPVGAKLVARRNWRRLPGLCLHDLMQLSYRKPEADFFDGLSLPSTSLLDEALKLLLDESAHPAEATCATWACTT